jgi:hypothetical protein
VFGSKPDKMIEIQLIGIENLNRKNRPISAGIRFYGRRVNDIASRLVVVELTSGDAEDIIEFMSQRQEMPMIEVPERSWAYVAQVGAGEAKFKEGEI